jgi:long-subunit fatty acid transport protein
MTENKSSGFDLTAGLGKEWRKGSTRLQGFYGADALVNVSSRSTESTVTTSTGTFVSSTENKSGLGLGLGVQGFLGAEYFIFPKFAIGAQYTYRVGFEVQGKSETTTKFGTAAATTVEGGTSSDFGFGNVGITSINLTLHF